jgi:hypothetical protein
VVVLADGVESSVAVQSVRPLEDELKFWKKNQGLLIPGKGFRLTIVDSTT